MSSLSVQGRVEREVWDLIRGDESNTKALQRIVGHYQATSGEELLKIAPTAQGAIAVLLNSHRLLNQILSNGSFITAASVPPALSTPAPVAVPAEVETTDSTGGGFLAEDNSADY